MDYYTENIPPENQEPSTQPTPNGSSMASAAMVFGILSLLSLLCVYPAFILGGVAIVLALLSRGKEKKLLSQAKAAIITSCVSIALSCIMIVGAVALIMSSPDFMDAFWESYESTYEDMYGEDFYDEMPEEFPFDEFIPTPEVPSEATDI